MNLRYVKINEGGRVTVKMSEFYDEKETALADEVCNTINANLKLKYLFADSTLKILSAFAKDMITAYAKKDEQKRDKTFQTAVDLLKGLTMHMCVQVMLKKKEVK